ARACVERDGGGAVGRSVVDHEHVVEDLARRPRDGADRSLGVERRNDRQNAFSHAASFEITAQTMPPPAEMELTRTGFTVASCRFPVARRLSSGSGCSNPTDLWRVWSRTASNAAASGRLPAPAYSPKMPFVATTGTSPKSARMARASTRSARTLELAE